MDSNLLKQFSEVIHRKKTRLNIRLAIFSFFFIIATILWYLNKLSNEYTTDLTFPVKIVNQPRGKVIVGEPVKEITLRVTAFGYYLLRYRIGSSLMPIDIDLNQTVLFPKENSRTNFFLLTSRLRRSISSQLSGEFQLEAILPDTLFFEFTSLIEKKVKIKPNLQVTFEKQFMQSGPAKIVPDSITISGPKSVVDSINEILSLPVKREKINTTMDFEATLPVINQVGFSHRKVDITLPVEKYTEASISLPIEVINAPEGIEVKLIPGSVLFKCNVVLSQYANLNDRYFSVQVDYNSIDRTISNKIRVAITRTPYFIQKYDFEPKYVEYIIEKH